MDLVCEMHPDYAEDVATFLGGHRACFCNMFIMRKEALPSLLRVDVPDP